MDIAVSGIDIIIVILLTLSAFRGYKRGLIRAVFDLVSAILALAMTYFFSSTVASFLRQTPLFTWIQAGVANVLGINERIEAGINNIIVQSDTIAGLPLPENVREFLHEHNNPEVHNALGITLLEDYITGFIAAMIINLISALAVFLIVSSILMIISRSLRLFNHIPIIGRLNRLGGAIVGASFCTLCIWLIFAVMTLLPVSDPRDLVSNTIVAKFFYDNNMLREFFTNISLRM